MEAIVSQGLTKSFDGGKTYALKDFTVKIERGEFIAVIGLSGAGKSTFLRAINGTNPPGVGMLNVLGHDVPSMNNHQLTQVRKEIGFIFQQFNLVKNITVLQNVLVGRVAYTPLWRSLTGIYSNADVHKAKAVLDSVGLNGRYDDLARNLSGGQQQRVAIARALVQDPKIILADEPMASLDPKLSEVVLDILKEVNEKQNITVLVNIHVLELAKRYAKRILALRQGHIIFDGPPVALTQEILDEVYRVEGNLWKH